MTAVQASSSSALFGSAEYTGVSHALGELQARRPILNQRSRWSPVPVAGRGTRWPAADWIQVEEP